MSGCPETLYFSVLSNFMLFAIYPRFLFLETILLEI